jgi:RNA polymerase sigma-70 factor (ECF subfamily)
MNDEEKNYSFTSCLDNDDLTGWVWRQRRQQFRERLKVFGARRLGDAALAEDLAQEVLSRVTEALREGRLQDLDALPAFIFQTATHLCLHHYRSRGREERALSRLGGMDTGNAKPGPLDLLVTEESRNAVRAALTRLRADDQDLLRRIYFDEEPSEDTARRLKVTPGTLRVRKHRALAQLAALLEQWRL